MNIGEEIIYSDKDGNVIVQYTTPEAAYIASIYDSAGHFKGSEKYFHDLSTLSLESLKRLSIFEKFLAVTQKTSSEEPRTDTPRGSRLKAQDFMQGLMTQPTPYSYSRPSYKSGYVEKYNNSDTLVFHKADPSTTMLSQLYEGKGFDVITDVNINPLEIQSLMKSHSRIMCLGHGTSRGLLGGNIGPDEAPYFAGKNIFAIWCNADAYFNRYCPSSARGKFITGNMPSEVWECRAAGCGNISAELMLENITYWSKLCADVVEMALSGDVNGAVDYVRKNYLEQYGNHPVTIYNAERTQGLNIRRPLPKYIFKGKPLQEKDFPYPGFDEAAFLAHPVAWATGAPPVIPGMSSL